ncbi:Y-family DNA polymerase [Thalassospira marina]|uniref:DNA-directed DNA polymerase n=1 Tax=Thalassospira marina TaxID=2048283 RepID=A0A2N3KEU1_9PROT|nr:DNA polymerase Y family protein [Thalassospira marina]PKR49044.1 nucleotidyltransferase [Thalassospira marina]
MKQRFLYLWLPHWKTDCHRNHNPHLGCDTRSTPKDKQAPQTNGRAAKARNQTFVVTRNDHKGVLVCGLTAQARASGILPAMRLAEARSILPDIANITEEPALYEHYQARIIRHLDRYSPWIAADRAHARENLAGHNGFWLEMTGGIHLFGNEETLMTQIERDLHQMGFTCQTGMADTAGAAWACAQFPQDQPLRILSLPADHAQARQLPVTGLRLPPATLAILHRLGIHHIHDLADLPRATLTTRLGPDVLEKLDQFYGRLPEHLNFHLPSQPWLLRQHYAEPLGDAANLEAAITQLVQSLCQNLQSDHKGLRRIILRCIRVDGHTHTVTITTSSPCQSAPHLLRLLGEKLPGVDTGFGIEEVIIFAPWVENIAFRQISLDAQQPAGNDTIALNELFDRISHHLGPKDQLYRPSHHASHLPELAAGKKHISARGTHARQPETPLPNRPIRLIDPPEPIQILQRGANGLPLEICWRRMPLTILKLQGPERICPEWWHHLNQDDFALGAETRDYFHVHDQAGRWLWLCRHPARRNPEISFADTTNPTNTTPAQQAFSWPQPQNTPQPDQDLWSVHGLFA